MSRYKIKLLKMKKLESLKDSKFKLDQQEMQSINGGDATGHYVSTNEHDCADFVQTDTCISFEDLWFFF
jgi:hypothetical protein